MNIGVTHFGVNTSNFRPMQIDRNHSRFVFGTVKTLSKKYGIKYIIGAFKLLLDKIQEEKLPYEPILEIYGKGDQEFELKLLCKKLGIEDKVIFKGYIANTDVPFAINGMDIFCLGSVSESESFGVAAVEAMSCSIPVIATNVSGFREVVLDGKTGYIVPCMDEIAFCEKMYKLMKNKELREMMGANGRDRVIQYYDWEINVSVMEDLYEGVVKRFNYISTKDK